MSESRYPYGAVAYDQYQRRAGTFVVNENRTMTFTPEPGFVGTASAEVVHDGEHIEIMACPQARRSETVPRWPMVPVETVAGSGEPAPLATCSIAGPELPRKLTDQVELVRRVLRASDARIEGLSVELLWREVNSVEVQRWSWELRQWAEIVRLCAEVERWREEAVFAEYDKGKEL